MSRSVFVKLKLTAPGGWHLLLSAAHTEESHLNRNGKVSLDETLLTRLFKKLVFGIVLRAHLVSLYLITYFKPCRATDALNLKKRSTNCNAIRCTKATRYGWKEFKSILRPIRLPNVLLNGTRHRNNSLFL